MTEIRTDDHAIVVYSDIACPWAHIAVHRLLRIRDEKGLAVEIPIDHRALPLELVNQRPTPRELLDVEVGIGMDLEPDAGWSTDADPWSYPVSTLPALEAVQASKRQGADISVRLDAALRRAFFGEWRCLAVLPVVLDVARTVHGLDTDALWDEIVSGRGRREVFDQDDEARSRHIPGSPTFVLPDGTVEFNPGIQLSDSDGSGGPTVEHNDPGAIAELLDRVLTVQPAD